MHSNYLANSNGLTTEQKHKPLILIVDDEPSNLHVLVEGLLTDYDVRISTSGEQALIFIESTRPDLILLDIMMPGMDGYEVCNILKAKQNTKGIPVIFVTALTEEESEEKGFAMGAIDYIHKPYKLALVRARIRTHITAQGMLDRLIEKNFDLHDKLLEIESLAKELSQREEELKELSSKQKLFYQALTGTADGVVIADSNGKIIAVNPSFCRITGYCESDSLQMQLHDIKQNNHPSISFDQVWEHANQAGYWSGELVTRRKNGELYPELLTLSLVKGDQDTNVHYIGVFSDISSVKVTQERIDYLTWHDDLTGLPNRNGFLKQLEQQLQVCSTENSYAYIYIIDIDSFHSINDGLGLLAGDNILKELTKRIHTHVSKKDVIARLGSDEFAVLCTVEKGVGRARAQAMAENKAQELLASVNHPFVVAEQDVSLTVSIGTYIFPREDQWESAIETIRNCEAACYKAKEKGGNRVTFFDTSFGEQAKRRFEIEQDLRKAILNNELSLYLQSQFDRNQTLKGAEVLLRWEHPQKGFISPGEFISIAEESDIIYDLDCWVTSNALEILTQLGKTHPELNLSINISGRHFHEARFLNFISQQIKQHNINPQQLTIEIIEGTLLNHMEAAIEAVHFLKKLGIRVSIDDFGTGYSSLTYLKQLPIQELKIDRSFVLEAPTDNNDKLIIDMIVSLGRLFELEIVAEGVENQSHFDLLQEYPEVILQGYYLHRPEPASDWLKKLK
ncbi:MULTISPECIES: EAL domain-containing protein [unclassified Pseudoalteromonas]|uniref:two-component system response regulator n=1 Tax=unclassified Pseudoalteromonas TaxID=194690 RepID=UPI0015FFB2D0|nr:MULTISPECIES: EAL domain-containing protein [unclassified Pseudoalteromonas]MBB1325601.1 EAL domain-containing protein [Pseudoalteromonas sp. SR45-1]MBB1453874.1 EAL domain-containing protein [Pseudoalteromonas sp. SG43-5]